MRKPKCPEFLDREFGKKLVKYLGGDASKIQDDWCWKEFALAYPELREKAEKYFEEQVEKIDMSIIAYCMCKWGGSSREWAERIIEKTISIENEIVLSWMNHDLFSTREWVEKVRNKI